VPPKATLAPGGRVAVERPADLGHQLGRGLDRRKARENRDHLACGGDLYGARLAVAEMQLDLRGEHRVQRSVHQLAGEL